MTFAFSIAVSVFGTEAGKVMLHRAIHRVLRVSRLVFGSVVPATTELPFFFVASKDGPLEQVLPV